METKTLIQRLRPKLGILAAFILCCGGCGGGSLSTQSDESLRVQFRGVVQDSAGQPISETVVSLVNNPLSVSSARTSPEGLFLLETQLAERVEGQKLTAQFTFEKEEFFKTGEIAEIPSDTTNVDVVFEIDSKQTAASVVMVDFASDNKFPNDSPGKNSKSSDQKDDSTQKQNPPELPDESSTGDRAANDDGDSSNDPPPDLPPEEPPGDDGPPADDEPPTAPLLPPPPEGLQSEVPLRDSEVSWQEVPEATAGYNLYRQIEGSDPVLIAELPAGTTTYRDSNSLAYTDGQELMYIVTSKNEAGESEPSRVAMTTSPLDFNSNGCVGYEDYQVAYKANATTDGDQDFIPELDVNGDKYIGLSDLQNFTNHFMNFCPKPENRVTKQQLDEPTPG